MRALTSIELFENNEQISKKNPERHDSLLEHQEWLYSTKTVFCRGLGFEKWKKEQESDSFQK